MLSALAAFFLGRYVLRSRMEKLAGAQSDVQGDRSGRGKGTVESRRTGAHEPVMPSGLKSYFLGLTRVKLPAYAWASMAGMFPACC